MFQKWEWLESWKNDLNDFSDSLHKKQLDCAVSNNDWVSHFKLLNQTDPSKTQVSDPNVKRINDIIESSLNSSPNRGHRNAMDKPFEVQEMLRGVSRLKNKKSNGFDAISNEMIKSSRHITAPVLANLFNAMLEAEYFPKLWGIGLMVPIFKSGEIDDPDNYRGVSLNSCLSKLFTGLLNERLVRFLDVTGKIKHNQVGFRKSFRTADHVFTLKTLLEKSHSKKEKLYTCFVDFKKAYDTIWRNALFYKMLNEGISSKFVNVIKSMYSSWSIRMVLPNGLSSVFPSNVGVKQGCNLSPTLFNIFINDFVSACDQTLHDSPELCRIPITCLLC